MFYVMERVQGRILWDPRLPGLDPAERAAICRAEIDTLARLHMTDPAAIGLGDYGRPGNYFTRQIDRWTKQYRASEAEPIPEMDRLIAWLPTTAPADDRTSIVHGDYRLDNMVLHADRPQVAAVLDWELSTLGDPLADFSYFLMAWVMGGEVAAAWPTPTYRRWASPRSGRWWSSTAPPPEGSACPRWTGSSRTTSSGWRASARASRGACATGPPRARRPPPWLPACFRSPATPGASPNAPGPSADGRLTLQA